MCFFCPKLCADVGVVGVAGGGVEEDVQLGVAEVCGHGAVARVGGVGRRVPVAGLVPQVDLLAPPQEHGGLHTLVGP